MRSFGVSLRNRLPALALGLAGALTLTGVTAITAPAAYAQAKSSEDFVKAYTAGKTAIGAKDWNTAISSADKAAGFAKTNQEKLAVEGIRTQAYFGLNKKAELLKSIETQLGMSGLSGEQIKNYKSMQMGLYSDLKNDAKALELTKSFIKDYNGGTPEQNAFVASASLKAKNYKEAITYANAAIDMSKKGGKKPKEGWYQIVQRAYFDGNDMPNYYATVERTAADYPTAANLEILIDRALKEPHFNRTSNLFDVQRAKLAAKVALKPVEQAEMGEAALSRGNAAESAKIFDVLSKANFAGIDATKVTRYKNIYTKAQADAKTEAATGLAAKEKDAAAAAKGDKFVAVGDAYLGAGDYAKAVDNIQKGITKGNLDEGQLGFAKLQLGIAQLKAGKKDDARKTWAEIKADNGSAALAKSWTLISKL